MKFIKLTSCGTNKPILIRDCDVIHVETQNYLGKLCSRLVLNTILSDHETFVWESIDHIHGLLK